MSGIGLGLVQVVRATNELSLRVFLASLLALASALQGASVASAQTDIFVRGSDRKFPIAIPQLCVLSGAAQEAAVEIADVMARNLALTGEFEVLNPGRFIEQPGKCASRDGLAYSDWTIVGADGLVKGELEVTRSEIIARMFLHDVPRQNVVVAKEYRADVRDARRIGHRFANEIVNFFTGRPGVFGSQIAFSGRTGRFKELFVMDMDGTNLRQLTNARGLILYPSWSPDGREILHTSYEARTPDLFSFDLDSMRSQRITNTDTLQLGSKFFRDRERILVSVGTPQGGARLEYVDRSGRTLRSLPGGGSVIDISPEFAPDFSEFLFCSNRGGGPQIYLSSLDGTDVRRVSFVRSNYCTSPTWSPRGDRIAFVCRVDGRFQIFSARPDGSDAQQLTAVGNNEDPSWSPDGEFIAFASTASPGASYNIAIMRSNGAHVTFVGNSPRLSQQDPAWSPVVPQ